MATYRFICEQRKVKFILESQHETSPAFSSMSFYPSHRVPFVMQSVQEPFRSSQLFVSREEIRDTWPTPGILLWGI